MKLYVLGEGNLLDSGHNVLLTVTLPEILCRELGTEGKIYDRLAGFSTEARTQYLLNKLV
jgi:hypothetical protein